MTETLQKKLSLIWLVLRVYLGIEWIEAGWHKLTGATPFDAAGFINGAIEKSAGAKPVVQIWWAHFLQNFALPHIGLFNTLVPYGEMLVGIALIIGFATTFALTMGMIMNVAFMLSGTISTSPNMVAIEFILLLFGGAYVGYLGIDYWFTPLFRKYVLEKIGIRKQE